MGCFFFGGGTQKNPPPNWPDNAREESQKFSKHIVCGASVGKKNPEKRVIGWSYWIYWHMSFDVMRKSCWASLLIILGFGGVSYEASHSSHADVSIRQLATAPDKPSMRNPSSPILNR